MFLCPVSMQFVGYGQQEVDVSYIYLPLLWGIMIMNSVLLVYVKLMIIIFKNTFFNCKLLCQKSRQAVCGNICMAMILECHDGAV